MIKRVQFEIHTFLLALQFLTRIPVRSDAIYSDDKMAASPRYYALVGILLGAFAAALYVGAIYAGLAALPAVLLSTALTCLLTGAFHEDGLADTFDGIGGGLSKEQSLSIMKDSRIGTYGAAALLFVVALKISVLASLPIFAAATALIAGHALSRVSSVLVIATSTYVRLGGTGKYTSGGLSTASLLAALAFGVATLLGVVAALGTASALGCVAGLATGHLAMRLVYERKLGGYTGDTLGAVQQVSETGCYIGLALCL